MAKSTRSNTWFVRVDGAQSFLAQKCQEMAQNIDVEEMLAAYHEGAKKENPHCHFVIKLKSDPQKQSFAIRIKKLFEVKDRNYALEVWDGAHGLGAVSYLFHEEEFKILVNRGFSEQDLADARKANDAVQRVVAINKEKASTKLPDKLYDHFKEMKGVTRTEVLHELIKRCRKGEHYRPMDHQIKQYVEEVIMRLINTDQEMDEYVYSLERRSWKD